MTGCLPNQEAKLIAGPGNVPRDSRRGRHQLGVVRHEQERGGVRGEHALQGYGRAEVKVIRRLVHHDELGPVKDAQGEHELAHLPGTYGVSLQDAFGLRVELRHDGECAASADVRKVTQGGEGGALVRLAGFLGDVERPRSVWKAADDLLDERRLAGAVVADESDVVGIADVQRGHAQGGVAEGQRLRFHAQEHPSPAGCGVEPHVGVVALLHMRCRKSCLGRRKPGLHPRRQPSRFAVLAGDHGDALLAASVAVVLAHAPEAALSRRAGRLLAAANSLALDPGLLPAGDLARVDGARTLERCLAFRLGIAARPHSRDAARHEQALCAERIQQLAIVGDEEPYAAEARERRGYGMPRACVHVVRRLVHGEHVGGGPEGAGHLESLLLAARERAVAPRPIVLDAEVPAEARRMAVVCKREVLKVLRRFGRVLGTVQGQEGRRDGARVWSQDPARHEREGRLSATVIADDAGPSLGERRRHPAQGGICRRWVRVLDVREVQLHGASGSAIGHAGQQGIVRLVRDIGAKVVNGHAMLHPFGHGRQR